MIGGGYRGLYGLGALDWTASAITSPSEIEHVRSDDPGTSRLQNRLNWLNRLVVCCDCNRPTLDSIRAAGFTVTLGGAHRAAEGPAVRPARHRGQRDGSGGRAACTSGRRPAHGCAASSCAASRMRSLVAEAAKEVHTDRQAALQVCAFCACGLS